MKQLAEFSGVSRSMLYACENGEKSLSLFCASRIACAMGITVNDLVPD